MTLTQSAALYPALFGLCILAVSLAIGLLGAFFIYRQVKDRRKAGASQQWPATPGRVTAAEMKMGRVTSGNYVLGTRIGNRSDTTYHPVVNYAYTVGGHDYVSFRVSFKDDFNQSEAERVLQQYAAGTAVTVYYDPADAQESVLDRTTPVPMRGLIFGIAAVGLSACCCTSGLGSLYTAIQQGVAR